MYLIKNAAGKIVEICTHPCYVKRETNGVVILAETEEADAIYSNDTNSFYTVARIGNLTESHTLEKVTEVPPEAMIAEVLQMQADLDYIKMKGRW